MARKRSRKSRKRSDLKKSQQNRASAKLGIESLDPRILMDASGVLNELLPEVVSIEHDSSQVDQTSLSMAESQSAGSLEALQSSQRHEIVFVDANKHVPPAGRKCFIPDLQIVGFLGVDVKILPNESRLGF